MQFHLPLSPIDQVLQPPAFYLIVQDWTLLYCMFGWTISFILYVRQAFRDQSYGIPIASVCANFAFDFLFGVVIRSSIAQVVCFVPWLIIDVGIVYSVVKFGPKVWKDSPLVARNFGWIIFTGILSSILMFWTIIQTTGNDNRRSG
ncbi:hypothetical protein CIB48_g8626 [Xylaria polymorpha]|nr:hypothetical protein CIB48_g8626 [Xylaria polymorpha]